MPRPVFRLALTACVLIVLFAPTAPLGAGEIQYREVEYADGATVLRGYLARPKLEGAVRPGMLLVHAWRGHGSNIRRKADELAGRGYIVFALDMYGKGVLAKDNAEARMLATPFYTDRALMRRRARLGLEQLRGQTEVDPKRIAAIGFCFGGTTVLELARDGADLAGVLSFHGGLGTPTPAKPGEIKAKLFAAHGGDDPLVKPADLAGFWKEMREARADYQILILSGAVHAFTDPDAGDDPSKGAAYSATAHRRAWKAMDRFLGEIFP